MSYVLVDDMVIRPALAGTEPASLSDRALTLVSAEQRALLGIPSNDITHAAAAMRRLRECIDPTPQHRTAAILTEHTVELPTAEPVAPHLGEHQQWSRLDGIAMPYGERTVIAIDENGRRIFEEFAPGSIHPDRHVTLNWRHDADRILGHVESTDDTAEGYWISARLAERSHAGSDAAALIRSGSLTALSVGFLPGDQEVTRLPNGDTLIVRTRARLMEVSTVERGAYHRARITRLLNARQAAHAEQQKRDARRAALAAELTTTLTQAEKNLGTIHR